MKVGREPVVLAGLKLLNEVGLDGLTLRGIAAELGVQAPTLYWRFKNKQDLVDEMATHVLGRWVADLEAAPVGAPWQALSWQDWAARFGRGLRGALLRHRDGARMVAGSYLTDTTLYRPMEAILGTFQAAGIAPDDAAACLMTIHGFVIGFTIEQQAVLSPEGERSPQYALEGREARIDPAQFPLTRSIGRALFDDYDARFDRGLQMIIAGFAAEG